MEWFIMVIVAKQLMLVGPFTESECHTTKRTLFADRATVCVERDMIDGKRKT